MKFLQYLAVTSFIMINVSSFAQKDKSPQLIHAVNNLSHYYDFHADWGFSSQYLNGGDNKYIKSWCCLYNTELANANLLFLFNCDDRLPYVEKDIQKIRSFLKQVVSLIDCISLTSIVNGRNVDNKAFTVTHFTGSKQLQS